MCIDSISIGNVPLPSKSTSKSLGKGAEGIYSNIIYYLYIQDAVGYLNILTACSNSSDLCLITFTIDIAAGIVISIHFISCYMYFRQVCLGISAIGYRSMYQTNLDSWKI